MPAAAYRLTLLGLASLAAPRPAAAQIQATEIVYVRQTQVNNKPYFEVRRRAFNGTADSKLVGGCLAQLPASYCTYADPVVSPDGSRLAFVFEPVSEEFCKAIWISTISGGSARQISTGCTDARPAWSPDGSRIAYERENAIYEVELCRNTLPESSPRRVAAGASPSYSRDGRWIAFARSGDIFKIRTNGSSETNLTQSTLGEWHPRWTKRGSSSDMIVFLAGSGAHSQVFTMDAAGQNRRQVTSTATAKSSPDVALLPSAVVWQEGTNVLFQAGANAPRTVTAGKQPYFGGGSAKVTMCP